jgi:hypothetical protein
LKMEAKSSSETSLHYRLTRRLIQKDGILQGNVCLPELVSEERPSFQKQGHEETYWTFSRISHVQNLTPLPVVFWKISIVTSQWWRNHLCYCLMIIYNPRCFRQNCGTDESGWKTSGQKVLDWTTGRILPI